MGCEHEFELAQITSDAWNKLQHQEWAYYYCIKCLFTVRKPVTYGLDATPKQQEEYKGKENI